MKKAFLAAGAALALALVAHAPASAQPYAARVVSSCGSATGNTVGFYAGMTVDPNGNLCTTAAPPTATPDTAAGDLAATRANTAATATNSAAGFRAGQNIGTNSGVFPVQNTNGTRNMSVATAATLAVAGTLSCGAVLDLGSTTPQDTSINIVVSTPTAGSLQVSYSVDGTNFITSPAFAVVVGGSFIKVPVVARYSSCTFTNGITAAVAPVSLLRSTSQGN